MKLDPKSREELTDCDAQSIPIMNESHEVHLDQRGGHITLTHLVHHGVLSVVETAQLMIQIQQ